MSGRAGRRGKDDRGIVIMMVDEMIAAESIKEIIKGDADPINSQFRLTYNMVLNLLRVEGINPQFMLERSFYQFQNYGSLPALAEKVKAAESHLASIEVPQEKEVAGYYGLKEQMAALGLQLRDGVMKPQYVLPFLQPGRMAHIKNTSKQWDFGWGMIVNFYKKVPSETAAIQDPIFIVDVLLSLAKGSGGSLPAQPALKGKEGVIEIIPCQLDTLWRLSAVRIKFPEDLRSKESKLEVWKTLNCVHKKFPEGPPLMDPLLDMKVPEKEIGDVVKKLQLCHRRLAGHRLTKNPDVESLLAQYQTKLDAERELREATIDLKRAHSVLQLDELKCRKRVLRRLNYADAQDVINLKGRVACEVSAADELLLTEMLFNGLFNDLSVQNATALLSCFVFEEKSEMPALEEDLQGVLRQMQEMATRIARVSTEAKMPLDEEAYTSKFKPNLMPVVHAWASGATFASICQMTDIYEGSIIRCMRRLEELLREMKCAATTMGNADLEKKFADGILRIKRDIVFAASLYL